MTHDELKSLAWLGALVIFFSMMAGVLVHRHMSAKSDFDFDAILLDKNGKPDIAVLLLIAAFFVDCFVLVYCLLKNTVPSGLEGLFTVFNITFCAPLLAKVIFKAKAAPATPVELLKGAHVDTVQVQPGAVT